MISWRKITGGMGNQMFQEAYLFAEFAKGNIPDIYLQDPKYFQSVDQDIKGMYRQGVGPLIDMVSIHVRRGDYVGNPFYADLTEYHNGESYYDKAIKLFPGASFLVFSDDIEFCKQYFQGKNFEFSEGLGEMEDFNLMCACKHNIIANSSFSWWAAYLNNNPEKKVVAPVKWFMDGVERTVCPQEWIRL